MKSIQCSKILTHLHVLILTCILCLTNADIKAQSSNHWTRNFNEESSLLSGAVVGGGAGAAAIFYNPAIISEIEESNLSINASLFSVDFLSAKNAWGDDLNLTKTRFVVVPRFISYMIELKKAPNLSLEVAFMNNENYNVEDVNSVDNLIDVLPRFDGPERYNAFYSFSNKFRDDWLGFGGSHRINENLVLGASMFVSARIMEYSYMVDIEAGSPQFITDDPGTPYYTAKYKEHEYVKFNNYRLLWKFGMIYTKDNLSLGLNISTPSVGVYSDGKRAMRKRSQSNINNSTGEPVPNFLISDFAEKKDVTVSYKSALSISAGLTYSNPQKTKTIYTTFEYFGGLDDYRMVEADENTEMVSGKISDAIAYDDWLTFVWGAKPVMNVAVGYRWFAREKVMVLGGIRTDFNYRKGLEYSPLQSSRIMNGFKLDRYHLTGGLTVKIFRQELMAGLQYSFGYEKNQEQFVNLSDPVEYNSVNHSALQGVKNNNMTTMLNSISLYFGATIKFGEKGDSE